LIILENCQVTFFFFFFFFFFLSFFVVFYNLETKTNSNKINKKEEELVDTLSPLPSIIEETLHRLLDSPKWIKNALEFTN